MSASSPDQWVLDRKIAEIELASVASPWRRPDSVIQESPGWFRISTPSSPHPWLNGVVRSILTAEEAPGRIQETIDFFNNRSTAFRWKVGPRDRPLNLSELLVKQGLRLTFDMAGMAADVDQLSIEPIPGVQVEEVGVKTIDEYVAASVAGWGTPAQAAQQMRYDMLHSLAGERERIRYFLARIDGTPVGSAALRILDNSGYLLGTSVVAEFRGRGVYRALVRERLRLLRELQKKIVTVQAIRETSAPICQKLGFEDVCSIQLFEWTPSLKGTQD